MPVLMDKLPHVVEHIMAQQMMSTNLVVLQRVDTLANIGEALKSGHHAFPVMNASGNLIGMIPRNFIIVLIRNRGFYEKESESNKSDGILTTESEVIEDKRKVLQETNFLLGKLK